MNFQLTLNRITKNIIGSSSNSCPNEIYSWKHEYIIDDIVIHNACYTPQFVIIAFFFTTNKKSYNRNILNTAGQPVIVT